MKETDGEDSYLAAWFGVEFIKGVQGNGVICNPKHLLTDFVADGGCDTGNIALNERELHELHMVPYRAAVIEAKSKSLMATYNAIEGKSYIFN